MSSPSRNRPSPSPPSYSSSSTSSFNQSQIPKTGIFPLQISSDSPNASRRATFILGSRSSGSLTTSTPSSSASASSASPLSFSSTSSSGLTPSTNPAPTYGFGSSSHTRLPPISTTSSSLSSLSPSKTSSSFSPSSSPPSPSSSSPIPSPNTLRSTPGSGGTYPTFHQSSIPSKKISTMLTKFKGVATNLPRKLGGGKQGGNKLLGSNPNSGYLYQSHSSIGGRNKQSTAELLESLQLYFLPGERVFGNTSPTSPTSSSSSIPSSFASSSSYHSSQSLRPSAPAIFPAQLLIRKDTAEMTTGVLILTNYRFIFVPSSSILPPATNTSSSSSSSTSSSTSAISTSSSPSSHSPPNSSIQNSSPPSPLNQSSSSFGLDSSRNKRLGTQGSPNLPRQGLTETVSVPPTSCLSSPSWIWVSYRSVASQRVCNLYDDVEDDFEELLAESLGKSVTQRRFTQTEAAEMRPPHPHPYLQSQTSSKTLQKVISSRGSGGRGSGFDSTFDFSLDDDKEYGPPTFLVISCYDMRREVFLLSSLGLAEHISKTIELVTVASQSLSSAPIEEYGRALQTSPASRTLWQPIYNPAEALPNFNNPKPPPGETVSEGSLNLWSLLDNHEGVLSQHYYEKLIFPKSEVETLKPSLKLYYRNMFPVPVYRNQKTGAIIWRSGHYSADAKQVSLTLDANERLLDVISRSSELSQGTPGVRVLATTDTASTGIASQIQLPWSCSSENLPSPSFLTAFEAFHAIRVICSGGPWKALKFTPEEASKLKEPLIDANFAPHCKRWMRKLSNSSWQVCVSKTLSAACSVVAAVTKEGVSVLVESGTSMVVAVLAQLLVNPIFRTIRGFAKLLEKDWVSSAYNTFEVSLLEGSSSLSLSILAAKGKNLNHQVPVMLVLLFDCISQLLIQFPTEFSFGESLLIFILDEYYLARFSSALIFSHSELRDLSDKAFPLWSYIGANLADFCNPFYRTDVLDGPCPPLQPNYKPSDLSFWSSYFLRHTFKPRIDNLKRVIAGMPLEIKNLKLSGEALPYFPSNLLIRATGIQILDLSNNELTQFPPEIENLVFLSKLRLQNNRIVYVHESLIRKLTSLQDLGLSSNGLKSIGGLEYLSRLEKLKLSSNRLEILPKLPSKVTALELDTNPATNANEIALGSCLRHADFSSLSLIKFPLQLLNSKDLVSLRMARNQLSDLPPIGSVLVKLQQLKMDHNPLLLKLPAALFSLKNLRFLSLDHCNISEVDKAIVSLSSLRSLSLANNCILTLPNEFFALKELRHLDLSGNVIEELPSLLGKLTQLEDLCLSHNAIISLPAEISNLSYLTSLDISYNQLKHLTPEIGLLNPLQELKFDGNSLKTPPQYIIDGGHKAVMQHLRSLCGQEVHPCYRIKLMVVGQENTGKTSLVRQLLRSVDVKKGGDKSEVSTDGITVTDFSTNLRINPEGEKRAVEFSTWDFAGQEVYYATHQFFLTDGALFIVVWNASLSEEFSKVEYWLQSILHKAPHSSVIIVGTHADEVSKQGLGNVVTNALHKYQSLYSNVVAVVGVSCIRGGLGVDKLWQAIELVLQEEPSSIGELIPTRYNQLEQLLKVEAKNRSPPTISWKEFTTFCGYLSFQESDIEYARNILHRYGVIFHLTQPKELADIVVLNPQWLIHMMATLLTTKHSYCTFGILHHNVLRDLWRPPEFPTSSHPLLIGILKKFDLAFCMTPDVSDFYGQSSLIPPLLPEERPEGMEKEWPAFTDSDCCQRTFILDFLPAGLFARFMVRILARRPKRLPKFVWRNGLLVVMKSKSILLELLSAQRKIQVAVRGNVTSELFTFIVESIESLTKLYNVTFKVEIPCVHCYHKKLYDPYLFPLKECEAAIEAGLSVIYCQGIIPVRLDKLAPDLTLAVLADKKIDYSKIQLQNKIDEGSFANVHRGTFNGQEVAVKELKLEDSEIAEFRREIWLMSGLYHQNIVKLIGFTNSPLCIVSEFITEGNLYDLIHMKEKDLSPPFVLRIALDIAKALRFIHCKLSHPIIHNDLKSPNVLLVSLDKNAEVVAKLTDFGLSQRTYWSSGDEVCTARMNPRWLAPEVLEGLSYSSKIDIYAFGVIIWEMITRADYMEDRFLFVIQDKILKGIRPDIPESCPKRISELIKLCWNGKPEIRPDINTCIDILSAEIGEQFPSLFSIAVSETPVQPILKSKKGGVRSRSADLDFIPRTTTSSSSSDLSDVKQLRPVKTITHLEQGAIQCMLHVERLNQVWIGDGSGRILVYNESGDFIYSKSCHEKGVVGFLMIQDCVWSYSFDGSIRIWNETLDLQGLISPCNVGALIKVPGFVWAGTYDMELWIINKRKYKVKKKINLNAFPGSGQGGLVTGAGSRIGGTGTVGGLAGATGGTGGVLGGTGGLGGGGGVVSTNTIGAMLYRKPYVWVGTNNCIIRVDINSQKVVDILNGHSKLIHKIIAIEDQNEIWSSSGDKTICVWDAKSGQRKKTIAGHGSRVLDIVRERSQQSVVWSASWDMGIYVWEAKTKRLLFECVSEHTDAVSCLLQVGGMIWTGSWDRKFSMWESIGLGTLIELAMRGEFEIFGNHLRSPLCFDSMGSSLNILSSSTTSSSSSMTTSPSPSTSSSSTSGASPSSSTSARNRGMSARRGQRVSVLHPPPMLGGNGLVAWRQAMPSKSQQEREARGGAMGVHWKKGTHNPNERKWKTFEPEKE